VNLHQELALAMQYHPQGRQVQAPRFWAAQAIARQWREVPEGERVQRAEAFLREDELDSGIVVGRGDQVRFWHLTFQEYLAARALAAHDERRGRLLSDPRLYQPEWREVVLLLAGVLRHQGIPRVDGMFSAVLDRLEEKASLARQARCFGLLGAAVRDLALEDYQPADPRYRQIAEEVQGIFDPQRSQSVEIRVAIEAAEALGQAGDPRFAHGNLENNWVEIPAGGFLMGAQKEDPSQPNYDHDASEWESPVHNVDVDAYHVGRYPVTVAEYGRFVDEGCYQQEQYWESGGFGRWQQPGGWEEQLAHPNRPVVGVSWFEASAYAARAHCRLPTEARWERAARGTEARKYPWGTEPEPKPSLLNYYEGGVRHATPVAVYPRGATPEGVVDMAGNVWEWCEDWYAVYPEGDVENPAGPDDGDRRVLRGGAWNVHPRLCRTAYRLVYHPTNRTGNVGFRLVRPVSAGTRSAPGSACPSESGPHRNLNGVPWLGARPIPATQPPWGCWGLRWDPAFRGSSATPGCQTRRRWR
jgi:formylglycine-generating enzyme required for sulfatase activity